MMNAPESSSTRPYLVRALYEWCTDNGLTPYVAVAVDDSVHVPREYVKNNEIVLNISLDATSSLNLGNDFIEFKARFGGIPRDIIVPMGRVVAIYARENGQGMAFPQPAASNLTAQITPIPLLSSVSAVDGGSDEASAGSSTSDPADSTQPPPPRPPASKRPALKRIK